jgi:hypothetical protein
MMQSQEFIFLHGYGYLKLKYNAGESKHDSMDSEDDKKMDAIAHIFIDHMLFDDTPIGGGCLFVTTNTQKISTILESKGNCGV